MLNRISQVLVTYVTRPAFWVLGTLYIVGVIAVANSGFSRAAPQQSVAPALPQSMQTLNLTDVESIQRFDAGTFDRNVRAATIFWHNESAEGSKPVRVWPDGRLEEITYPPFSSKHLRQLKECRRLRTLTLQFRGYLTDDEWQALGELDQITALKYGGVVSPFGMRQIARLRKLHFLDLSGCTFDEGLEGLESLESLQNVVLDNFVENRVHVLGQLRRLPHLRTLVATHYRQAGSIIPRGIWISDLDDLRAATGLQRWFVDEHSRGFPGFDALARELPGIAVRPVQIDFARQVKCIPVGLLTGILIFLLALQLNSQFAHPAARLTPGYAVPHLIPATVLWLCSVLVPACLLASATIPILPLVGISMAIWLVIGSLILNSGPARSHTTGQPALASLDHVSDSDDGCPLASLGVTRHAAQSICLRLVPARPRTRSGNRHDLRRCARLCAFCPEILSRASRIRGGGNGNATPGHHSQPAGRLAGTGCAATTTSRRGNIVMVDPARSPDWPVRSTRPGSRGGVGAAICGSLETRSMGSLHWHSAWLCS